MRTWLVLAQTVTSMFAIKHIANYSIKSHLIVQKYKKPHTYRILLVNIF